MRLEYMLLRGVSAERFGRLGAGMLARMERDPAATPRLLVAELEGESLVLGRHQRASSALAQGHGFQVARRLGGGRTVAAGAGRLGVLLGLPAPGALLPSPVAADKLINRYVRGLDAGLTAAGAGSGAHYFGRDFVSAESRQLAVVSQDGSGSAAVFEAIVAVEASLALPAGANGYPEHEDPRAGGPPPVTLAELWSRPHRTEEIADAIAHGYERLQGCELVRVEEGSDEAELAPPAAEDEAGFEESGVADIAIGFAEALVRHDGEKVIEARLRGDFVAPAFAIRSLETSLAGCPLEFAALGARVDAAFKQPGASVLGVRSLRVFADAILAAAGKLG